MTGISNIMTKRVFAGFKKAGRFLFLFPVIPAELSTRKSISISKQKQTVRMRVVSREYPVCGNGIKKAAGL